jgi:3-oxoacyl-[acyl-carrier-protein] synthase-3
MNKQEVYVRGTGFHLPEKVLTNFDLEKMVDTSDEWIVQRTGIKTRRIASNSETTSDLALKAAQNALSDAGITAEDLDGVIVATFTPDMFFPSCACVLSEKLGISGRFAFDVEAACSGFIYAFISAAQFIQNGIYENILVVGADTTSKTLDWEDRTTCVLFGDGAGAVVLSNKGPGLKFKGFTMGSDGKGYDYIHIPVGGSREPANLEAIKEKRHYFKMRGRDVFKFAVHQVGKTIEDLLQESDKKMDALKYIIPHQANIRILRSAANRFGLSDDSVYVNIDRYGNTVAATVPIALSEFLRETKINAGEGVALIGFGGGLSWGGIYLEA